MNFLMELSFLKGKEKLEGKDDVKLLLESILGLNEMFKAKYIANFVAGKGSSDIKSFGHDTHKMFGLGKQKEGEDNTRRTNKEDQTRRQSAGWLT